MNRFGVFYYSKKMAMMDDEMRRPWEKAHRNYARPLFSTKVVEYNEWVDRFPFTPLAKWDDIRLVCVGFYDHTEVTEAE